jgi:glycosyltransferase involved in cell wall biosynthesis
MLRVFDAFLDVGQWSREYYLHYGVSQDRIFHVPHVIDEGSFLFRAESLRAERNAIRAAWELPFDATVFLFAGKFIAKKNPLDFVRAFEIAAYSEARVAGLMVGDGPQRSVCQSLVRDGGLAVTFAGFLNQSEITRAYIAADCLVLPSDGGETWGIVVNEAMWCELPCIVSDQVGCGPDLVARQGTGRIFPLHDAKALADAMVSFARSPDERLGYAVRARKLIQSYSVASAVEGTVNAVAAVKRGARP